MAPISLKDPNIQRLTEEFVKVLTGFKVMYDIQTFDSTKYYIEASCFSFYLQKSSRNFTVSVQFALSNFR